MDYQCPPCRASHPAVQALLQSYHGKMNLVVRNLPLRMHKNALRAAAAAEAARAQNKFEPMHDALLTGGALDKAEIEAIARKVGLNMTQFNTDWNGSAPKRVAADEKAADALGLDSTPTFLLCSPKGQWQLSRLEQVKDLVK